MRNLKRYHINFTNDRGAGCFGTYASKAKAEKELAVIMNQNPRDIAEGYKDIHLNCEIVEEIITR